MDEFTELFEKSKNDHESKMIVGSEVRYIINAVRSERARITSLETALATVTAERDESGRRLGEFQLRLAGALIASEGGNGCPDGAIECIRTCPTIASVMRLRAERDELRKACQAALDTFMGIRVGGVIATEIMLRSALARAAVEGER